MYWTTPEYTEANSDDETPLTFAAANPDPTQLKALLAQWAAWSQEENLTEMRWRTIGRLSPSAHIAIYGVYNSPLKSAISANLADNVRLLLDAGADPSGIGLFDMSDYSVRFIRGRHFRDDVISFATCKPRAQVLAVARSTKGISNPVCPLTEAELDERRHGFARFWTEPNVPGQCLRMQKALTMLEVAAKIGNLEILDLLRAAGADESAWLQAETTDDDDHVEHFNIQSDNPPISALSTSSPVHEAITAGNQSMLRHLLSCGHSPDYRPRAAPTVALPPLSYAIARCDLTNPGVQGCVVDLLSHPKIKAELRTPVFDVHLLHFATAHHDPDLLSWLAGFTPGGLGAAGVTALGHTLLHIASLPLTTGQIVARNTDVAKSLHCARTLDSRWRPYRLPSPLHTQFVTAVELASRNPTPLTISQQRAQLATIRLLVERGSIDISAQDVDGNTALHYLAGTLNMSEETVDFVRRMDGGDNVWHHATNYWGLTPSQLWGE